MHSISRNLSFLFLFFRIAFRHLKFARTNQMIQDLEYFIKNALGNKY